MDSLFQFSINCLELSNIVCFIFKIAFSFWECIVVFCCFGVVRRNANFYVSLYNFILTVDLCELGHVIHSYTDKGFEEERG